MSARAGLSVDEWLALPRDMPTLLDAFCCEGGASEGYRRAGWDVYGVDKFEDYRQANYPFPSHKGDAIAFIREHGHKFDARHASPPCHHGSAGTRSLRKHGTKEYPALIEATREALEVTGLPYVIENVEGTKLHNPTTLCGTMFSLGAVDTDGVALELWRHRGFETNWALTAPCPCDHGWYSAQVAGCYGGARSDKHEARNVRHGGYVPKDKAVLQDLMGIDWMTKAGMYQALPPVYTQWIGAHLIDHIAERKAA
jgi:DNA (cytosine-5)-methyltransferase 1